MPITDRRTLLQTAAALPLVLSRKARPERLPLPPILLRQGTLRAASRTFSSPQDTTTSRQMFARKVCGRF